MGVCHTCDPLPSGCFTHCPYEQASENAVDDKLMKFQVVLAVRKCLSSCVADLKTSAMWPNPGGPILGLERGAAALLEALHSEPQGELLCDMHNYKSVTMRNT